MYKNKKLKHASLLPFNLFKNHGIDYRLISV